MAEGANGPAGPLQRERLLYRWDLDKTYLRTDFDTARALLARAFEGASAKLTVPGAASLLRELRNTGCAGIYILSGSPEQMRRVLEAKLRLDGIEWDGFTLKPSLKNLLRGHFGFLRDQVGFKLGAMLAAREPLRPEIDEVLFGDDAETDVFVYSLYADLCAGRVGSETLAEVLRRAAVRPDEIPNLVRLCAHLPKRDHCRRIFIHLERMSSVHAFEAYGTRVCPFYNYFQPALVLLEMGALDPPSALRVAAELVIEQGFTPEALIASYQDLARRGQVTGRAGELLVEQLGSLVGSTFATATPVLAAFARELQAAKLEFVTPRPIEALDYVALLSRERARARAAKLRVLSRIT